MTRYQIGDVISNYQVISRYYCQSPDSRALWSRHEHDDIPVFDRVMVNMDTGLAEHVIITHADDDGIIPYEQTVDRIIGYDTLMTVRLITCHPSMVRLAYPFWSNHVIGDWQGDTYTVWIDGILYVCAEDTTISIGKLSDNLPS